MKERTGCVTYNEARKAWVARIDWTDETGHRRCRKKQVKDKTAGRRLVRRWIRELSRHGSSGVEGDRVRFDQLARHYLERRLQPPVYRGERKVAGLRSYKSLRGYLRVLVAHFGRQTLRSISHADIERFKLARLDTPVMREREGEVISLRERSLANVHRELALLRQMFVFAEREGWLPVSPFKRGAPLINLADETRRERLLSREEEERLLAVCTGRRRHLRAILVCALDCGLRRGELLALKWSDVDLEGRELRLRSTTTKTARSRVVGISRRVGEELRRLWDLSPGDPQASVFGVTEFSTAFASACLEAGVDDFHFHDCRHTFVSRAVAQGISISEAMALAGHTTLSMHARYANITSETARRGREAMDDYADAPREAAPVIN